MEENVEEKKDLVEDTIEEVKEEITDNNEKKSKSKKKFFLIGFIVLVIILAISGVFLWLSSNSIVDEKDFLITSITPKSKNEYVSNNETFIVETNDADVEMVKRHLYVEPAVNYDIKKINKNKFEVEVNNIPSDTLVNLSLVKDEIKSYSWAFQSTKELQVSSVYPANGSSSVSTNTGIHITLSYPNVENLKDHFEISPQIDGSFTQIGRVWTFIPSQDLKNNTTYTITITKGLKAGDYTLDESYKSTFSTYNRPNSSSNTNQEYDGRTYKHSTITLDSINTFTPTDFITFKQYTEEGTISKIKMYQFSNLKEFLKFINNDSTYTTTDLGEQEFEYNDKYRTYTLKNTFDEGYYVEEVYLDSGEIYTTIPVQVNKLSAFMFASDDDLFLWVGSGNELLKDVNVTYNNKTYKTGNDGTLKIENYNNESSKLEYVTVGDKTPLIIGVTNFQRYNYPRGYIYTDKPVYKNTDTIRIWGYIPINFYKEMYKDFKKQDFVLKYEKDNIPIEINDDGTFVTKYELDNHIDDYGYLELNYKNVDIAYRDFKVSNYSKQYYEYDVSYDKNYIQGGDYFKFTVHVNHITGIDVANKSIIATYKEKNYESTTDSQGNAYFSIPTKKENLDTYSFNYISVKTGEAEYNENSIGVEFYTINKSFAVTESQYNPETSQSTLKVRNITLNKDIKEVNYNLYETLDNGPFAGNVHVELYEIHNVKRLYSTYYNSYTRKTENIYSYDEVERKVVDTVDSSITNGTFTYKVNYDLKENTEDDNYSYIIDYRITKGNETINTSSYVYTAYDYSRYNEGKYFYSMNSGIPEYSGIDYYYYRYFMDTNNDKKLSVNDQITLILNSYDNSAIPEDAKVLRISFKNKIIDSKIFTKNENLSTKFTKNDVPGVGYIGAIYTNGRFYRLPSYYYDYKEEDSKLNITVTKDKESYSPGEKVHLKINVKDKDNKGVKSRVAVSIVDKAIFNVAGDTTDILERIFSNLYYRDYAFSTFRDYEIFSTGGGRGDTGGVLIRTKFSDTIYFDELQTNDKGEVELDFELNDSVTTFVVTVHAATDDAHVGVHKEDVVSTLPLAISVLEPHGLKATDDIVIGANSVGSVKNNLNYTFELVGTDKKIEKTGKIGQTLYANFGKLEIGNYKVRILATDGNAKDAIEFPFEVKESQQEISVKNTSSIEKTKEINPTRNPIILEFYKSGFAKYINYLDILVNTNEDRLDTKVAYFRALEYENKYYGTNYPVNKTDMSKFNKNGILSYLENEEKSLLVTALVSYYSPDIYKLDKTIYYTAIDQTSDAKVALDNLLVLSAMKEPVLDELKYIERIATDPVNMAKLSLAYAFIGDYDSAKRVYKNIENNDDTDGLIAIVSTFIDKNNSEKYIDELYKKNIANRYVYFAIVSYFMNNETDLSKESTITVKYGDNKEEIKISGLMMKKISINNKDLKTLNITSTDKTDMINYYYEGGIKEVAEENIKKNIQMSLDSTNLSVGKSVNLKLNISKISSGNIKIYLPNSLKLSSNTSNKGAYISANRGEYIILSISKDHDGVVSIPLYVTYPGEYTLEEVIMKEDNNYYISNSLTFNVK